MNNYLFLLLFTPLLTYGQADSIAIIAESKINVKSENPVHSILLRIENADNNYVFSRGFGSYGKSKQQVGANSLYRIASETKLFVSTIILQLVDERKVKLNDKAYRYLHDIDYLNFDDFDILNGKRLSNKITIEQLLSHRTGLADIFTDKEEEFFNLLMENPQKQYSTKAIVGLYFQFNLNRAPHFKPNHGWYYSDLNYVLLGLIIESIEQKPLHKSIRERILTPLNMENTYFEFYETPIDKVKMVDQYVGKIDFTDINTSFDWAGGGLVSTNEDMSTFIKALFENKLISRKSLKKMIDVRYTKKGENRYGLGIYESEYNGKVFYGHYGFYGSYIGYCPESRTVISYSISQATPDFNVYGFINKVIGLTE